LGVEKVSKLIARLQLRRTSGATYKLLNHALKALDVPHIHTTAEAQKRQHAWLDKRGSRKDISKIDRLQPLPLRPAAAGRWLRN
jgi:hypothetical protein